MPKVKSFLPGGLVGSSLSISMVMKQFLRPILRFAITAAMIAAMAYASSLCAQTAAPIIYSNVAYGWPESIAYSDDDKYLAVGNERGTVELFDTQSGRLIRIFKEKVTATRMRELVVAISPTEDRVAAVNKYGLLNVWDLSTGHLIAGDVDVDFMWISPLKFLPDGKGVLLGNSKGVTLFDTTTWAPIRTFAGSANKRSMAVVENGKYLLLPNKDGRTIQVFTVATGQLVRNLKGHLGPVDVIAPSPDGRFAASFSAVIDKPSGKRAKSSTKPANTSTGNLIIWDLTTGTPIHSIAGNIGKLGSASFTKDSTQLVLTSDDATVKICDVATGAPIVSFEITGPSAQDKEIVVSPGATQVLSRRDDLLTTWSVTEQKPLRTIGSRVDPIRSIVISRDGKSLLGAYTGGEAYKFRRWNLTTGEVKTISSLPERPADDPNTLVALSNDTKLGATGRGPEFLNDEIVSKDYPVFIWDAETGKQIRVLTTYRDGVKLVMFAPDGTHVLSSNGKTTTYWDLSTGRPNWTRSIGAGSASFSRDGRMLIIGGDRPYLIDASTGKVTLSFPQRQGGVWIDCVAFSPSEKKIVVGNRGGEVLIYNLTTRGLERLFELSYEWVLSAVFSPDETRVLAGSRDGTAVLWDLASKKRLFTFSSESGSPVESVIFAPNNRRAFTSHSLDGSIRIWDLADGQLLVTLTVDGDDHWVAQTAAGFFAASNEGYTASDYISIVRGLKTYSVLQFFDELYYPDLVEELFRGDLVGKYADKANQLDLQKIMNSGSPPQIELVEKKTDVATSSVQITLKLYNNAGGGIGKKLIWRLNGVAFGRVTPPELQNLVDENGPIIVRHGLALDPNKLNIISVTANNGKDLWATEPLVIEINKFGISTETKPRPKMYVLGIAVDHYDSGTGLRPLQFAAKDIDALSKSLKSVAENGGYEIAEIIPPLIDGSAVREKIADVFARLKPRVKPWDAFVLILAGHGKSVSGRGYFFLPQNIRFGDGHDIFTDGINTEQWRDWLALIETDKRLLIIDTCESGEAIAIERGGEGTAEHKSAIDRIQEAVGHSVITASRQIAYEGNVYGHGVLTYAILEALGTPHGDGGMSQ